MIEFEEKEMACPIASIKVVGIGGAGGNTVNSMIEAQFNDVEFIVANTDAQALDMSKAEHRIQLGIKSTKGLGTGANPELGKRAAQEDLDKVMAEVEGADIVFLTGGMGGGTGSGALPVLANALRELGILSIAVVTKPFTFEGRRRSEVAHKAIEEIKQAVDTLIIIPNEKLLEVTEQNVSMIDAFAMINDVLGQSVKGIADIITKPGHINVDFADVRAIMKDMGLAVMGTAKAEGQDRAEQAALEAITSPLLENMSIEGARGVLLNISGGPNLGLHEISAAAHVIYDQVDENANIILGSVIDQNMQDEVVVTVIATGFSRTTRSSEHDQRKAESLTSEPSVKYESAQEYAMREDEKGAEQQEPVSREMKKEERTQESSVEKKQELIDMSNLDVPTFLRKKEMAKEDHS